MLIFNPNNPPIFNNPSGNKPGSGKSASNIGANPGLVTSTGGIIGFSGYLLSPVFNTVTKNSYVLVMDPNNFNCEEASQYVFPQTIPPLNAPQEGRDVSCHLMILKYRELGVASFTITIWTFNKTTDSFQSVTYNISIPAIPLKGSRKLLFPDGKIHTLRIPIQVNGERPQPVIFSNANAGPYSIVSLTLCGNTDETAQQ